MTPHDDALREEAKRVGERIRLLRLARNWVLTDLAGFVGVSKQAVAKVETGKTDLAVSMLLRYALAFEVPPSLLLGERPSIVQLARMPLQLRRDYILASDLGEEEEPDA